VHDIDSGDARGQPGASSWADSYGSPARRSIAAPAIVKLRFE
jgi:hypothetical protein